MKFNTIIHLIKIAFLAWLTALLIACGDTTTAPNPDISGYSLTYNNIAVPQNTASSVSVSPNWSVTPTEVSYSLSPNLPSGAILNPTTGVISGTINISAGTTTYTVTATGSGANTGTTTATFTITAAAPVDLSSALLTYQDINVHVNSPASTSPMWTNYDNRYDFSVIYQVSPSLPAGLSIDTNSGIISGSSTAPVPTSSYTVTATGAGVYTGSNTTTLNITVAGAGQTLLNTLSLNYNNIGVSYSNGVEVYTINISTTPNPTIANISPQWSNPGAAVTLPNLSNAIYTITPALPGWLSFDAGTGKISRTTSSPSAYYRQHTVTATDYGTNGNYVGTKDATVVIAIAENANDGNIQSLVDTQISDQGDYANLNIIDTSQVTSMVNIFNGNANFNGDISRWDVGNVANMQDIFASARSFNGNLSNWDVSSVTNMRRMFLAARSFNGDISTWNVSNVNNMEGMFNIASSFNQNISGWNVSNVNNMEGMFNQASSFNQNISGWNVSNVNNMEGMFSIASSFSADLEVWNVATSVNTSGMFTGSGANPPVWARNLSYSSITYLAVSNYNIGSHSPNWDISLTGDNSRSVTYSITPDISAIGLSMDANGVISGSINTTNITNSYTVTAKPSINSQNYVGTSGTVNFTLTTIDVSTLKLSYNNIGVITNDPAQSSPSWSGQTYPVTVTYAVSPSLPSGLTLNSTNGIISGNPSNSQLSSNYTITATGNGIYSGSKTATFSIIVGSGGEIFLDNLTLTYGNIGVNIVNGVENYTINISNNASPSIPNLSPQWSGTQTPTNTTYAITPTLPTWLGFNSNTGDITNNGSPTNAYYRRHTVTATGNGGYIGKATSTVIIAIAVNAVDRNNLLSIVNNQITTQGNEANLNIIDTSRVTDMSEVFRSTGFNGDISRWDVSKVTNMQGLFQGSSSFNGNISSWNVENVVNMANMFAFAFLFNDNISSWDVGNVTNMSRMFDSASVFNGNLSSWNVRNVVNMGQMFTFARAFQGTGLSAWANRVGSVTTMVNMFNRATAFTEDLSSWVVPSTANITGMFDNSGVANNEPSWCTTARNC